MHTAMGLERTIVVSFVAWIFFVNVLPWQEFADVYYYSTEEQEDPSVIKDHYCKNVNLDLKDTLTDKTNFGFIKTKDLSKLDQNRMLLKEFPLSVREREIKDDNWVNFMYLNIDIPDEQQGNWWISVGRVPNVYDIDMGIMNHGGRYENVHIIKTGEAGTENEAWSYVSETKYWYLKKMQFFLRVEAYEPQQSFSFDYCYWTDSIITRARNESKSDVLDKKKKIKLEAAEAEKDAEQNRLRAEACATTGHYCN